MYKEKSILGVIPARGGSKGLPNKNVKLMNGHPLIAWTINAAVKSSLLDKVYVTTDDVEIAQCSEKYGVKVPELRPEHLATDDAPISKTITFLLDQFKEAGVHYDYVALLEPTSPLRNESDIDEAIKKLVDDPEADSLVSCGEVATEHPAIVKRYEGKYVVPYFEKVDFYQRQQLDKAYFPYGVIYLCKSDVFRETETFYSDRNIYHEIERWQNYEVDDAIDFMCIESIMKNRKLVI